MCHVTTKRHQSAVHCTFCFGDVAKVVISLGGRIEALFFTGCPQSPAVHLQCSCWVHSAAALEHILNMWQGLKAKG